MSVIKLYFEKSTLNEKSCWYTPDDPFNDLIGYFLVSQKFYNDVPCAYHHIDENIQKKLHDKLKSMFPSLQTKMGPSLNLGRPIKEICYDRYMFKFKNKSDEAHFTVWANSGIEIIEDNHD